jgi:hypothetical protein
MKLSKEQKAAYAALKAEKRRRAHFLAHPELIAEVHIGDDVVKVMTGVPRPSAMSSAPPDVPPAPPGREQPPRRRDPTEPLPPPPKPDAGIHAIEVIIRDNSATGMPDDIASAFWMANDSELWLCRADGRPLDNGAHKVSLRPYEDARGAAERLLKKRHGSGNDFTAAKIKYPPLKF